VRSRTLFLALVLWSVPAPVWADDRSAQFVIALREALQLAIERAVGGIARPDGFLGNPSIRLGVPDPLAKVESKLRMAGQEAPIEKFVVSLNRAAEHAALAARAPLLVSASELYVDDAHRLLAAGETAMTEALRRHALGQVLATLNPAVTEATSRVGTTRRYKRFVNGAHFGGLLQQPLLDLDAYIAARTADGIFHAIGQEERRIRTDPAARPTARLREVFGAQR
jgi:hypothetical protein